MWILCIYELSTIWLQGARIVKSSHFELDYMLGRKITFFCMAQGFPRPHITWFKDGIELYAHKFFQVTFRTLTKLQIQRNPRSPAISKSVELKEKKKIELRKKGACRLFHQYLSNSDTFSPWVHYRSWVYRECSWVHEMKLETLIRFGLDRHLKQLRGKAWSITWNWRRSGPRLRYLNSFPLKCLCRCEIFIIMGFAEDKWKPLTNVRRSLIACDTQNC